MHRLNAGEEFYISKFDIIDTAVPFVFVYYSVYFCPWYLVKQSHNRCFSSNVPNSPVIRYTWY